MPGWSAFEDGDGLAPHAVLDAYLGVVVGRDLVLAVAADGHYGGVGDGRPGGHRPTLCQAATLAAAGRTNASNYYCAATAATACLMRSATAAGCDT